MKFALLALFWTMWYLAFSSRTALSPFLPMIENEFLINHATAGSLYLFTATGGTLALFSAGPVSLRIGYKRLIIIGFILAFFSLVGIYFTASYFSLALCLFVFGLGGGFYMPCAIPILTDIIAPGHWGKAISFHETASGFSLLSFPFLAAVLLGFMPWRYVFATMSAVFLVACCVFWVAAPDTQPKKTKKIGLHTIIKRADFWIIMALWTISATGVMGVYNIVPLFLVDEREMAIEAANHVLSFSRIGGFAGQIIVGFILDRFDSRKIIFILTVSSGLALLGMSLTDSNLLIIILLFFQATCCTVFFPVGITAISRLTEPEERSYFAGTIMAVSSTLSIGVSPVFLGLVADMWSFQVGFLILGLITLFTSYLARLL